MRIETNRKQIPWSWAFIVLIPWLSITLREQLSSTGMAFTLRRFIDDPAVIGRVLSTNYAFGITVGSLVAFLSDHIWTRWGRRRPFLIFSWVTAGIFSILIPYSESAWIVISMIILYQLVVDFGGPYEPITMEVVPPFQRGRAQAIAHWYKTAGFLLLFYVLLAQFDNVYNVAGMSITGEQVLYWVNALLLFGSVFIMLFVREQKPENFEPKPLIPLLVNNLLKELIKPRMLLLMGLAYSMQNLWMGLGVYEPLLVTEQWGYTKEMYSKFMAYSMIVTVCLVPLAGWISDRMDRMFLLKVCLGTVVTIHITFYVTIQFFIDGPPPIIAVFVIGLMKSTVASFMSVACVPLIFDYVRSNRLGLLGCAMGLVFSLVSLIGTNVMGEWVKFSSIHLYKSPEGTWEYLAAYHWIILSGILGFCYLFFFSRMERKGVIGRVALDERDGPPAEP